MMKYSHDAVSLSVPPASHDRCSRSQRISPVKASYFRGSRMSASSVDAYHRCKEAGGAKVTRLLTATSDQLMGR